MRVMEYFPADASIIRKRLMRMLFMHMARIVGSGTASQRAALREGDYTLLKRMMLDQSRMQPPMQKAEPSVSVDAINTNDASGKNKSNVDKLHDDIDDTKCDTEKNLKFQKAYNSTSVPFGNDPFLGRSPSYDPDSETTFKGSEETCEKENFFTLFGYKKS